MSQQEVSGTEQEHQIHVTSHYRVEVNHFDSDPAEVSAESDDLESTDEGNENNFKFIKKNIFKALVL